jgi:hypothetical protein
MCGVVFFSPCETGSNIVVVAFYHHWCLFFILLEYFVGAMFVCSPWLARLEYFVVLLWHFTLARQVRNISILFVEGRCSDSPNPGCAAGWFRIFVEVRSSDTDICFFTDRACCRGQKSRSEVLTTGKSTSTVSSKKKKTSRFEVLIAGNARTTTKTSRSGVLPLLHFFWILPAPNCSQYCTSKEHRGEEDEDIGKQRSSIHNQQERVLVLATLPAVSGRQAPFLHCHEGIKTSI